MVALPLILSISTMKITNKSITNAWNYGEKILWLKNFSEKKIIKKLFKNPINHFEKEIFEVEKTFIFEKANNGL